MRVTVAAPAKINLILRVGPLDDSGFHALDTLFCALELADTVVLRNRRPDDAPLDVSFAPPLESLPELGPPEENLAVRAARAFAERAGLDALPHIRLIKRVPAGGGLGGGSSDAAAVLRAMNRLHPGALSGDDVLELAASLGSDVPFFALGTALARGRGRGDRLEPLEPLAARSVVLVLPPFGVGTADAYRWLDEARDGTGPCPLPEAGTGAPGDWEAVRESAENDFEDVVFTQRPELATIRDGLRALGGRPALLAGSGSTVFGIFDGRDQAEHAARALGREHPDCQVLATRTRVR